MRDTISWICNELMSDTLPLLRPTANNENNVEPETDCYQLNEKSREPYNLEKLSFLGYFLGWSLISIGSLNLELPSAFWNRLCGGPDYVYSMKDVRSQDALLANYLENIRTSAAQCTQEEFAEVFGDLHFVYEGVAANDGKAFDLCP